MSMPDEKATELMNHLDAAIIAVFGESQPFAIVLVVGEEEEEGQTMHALSNLKDLGRTHELFRFAAECTENAPPTSSGPMGRRQ